MMNKHAAIIAATIVVAPTVATAFGQDDRWVSGWGQGIAELIVTHGP